MFGSLESAIYDFFHEATLENGSLNVSSTQILGIETKVSTLLRSEMTLTEYSQLKRETVMLFSKSEKPNELLCFLKDAYKGEINSPRRYEQIRTIGQLLDILEIRDILSEDNVKHLKNIALRLSNNENLIRKIEEYEATYKTKQNISCHTFYGSPYHNSSEKAVNDTFETFASSNPYTMSKRKRERIVHAITEEIGIYWRDLGRNLHIAEGTIDEIEATHVNFNVKASELLRRYERKADPQRWFFTLCEALEKSRRKDLSKELQNIMTMNL